MGKSISHLFKHNRGGYSLESSKSETVVMLDQLRIAKRCRKETKQRIKFILQSLCLQICRSFFDDLLMISYDKDGTENVIYFDLPELPEGGVQLNRDSPERNIQIYRVLDWSDQTFLKITLREQPNSLKIDYEGLLDLLFSSASYYPHMTCYVLYRFWRTYIIAMEICLSRLNRHMGTVFLRMCNYTVTEGDLDSLIDFIPVFDRFYNVKSKEFDYTNASVEYAQLFGGFQISNDDVNLIYDHNYTTDV